jgi:hypothetical protein
METSKVVQRRNTLTTTKKPSQSNGTLKPQSRGCLITPADLQSSKVLKTSKQSTQAKSSKLIGFKSPLTPKDADSQSFSRASQMPKLTVPPRGSFIYPSYSEEKLPTSKYFHQASMSTSVAPDPTVKKSKDLTLDIKKTLKELREEAENCMTSNKSSSRKSLGRKPGDCEYSENERDSFTTKTPFSSDLTEDPKSGLLKKEDVLDMKQKIDFLFDKIHKTELETKEHELENLKLKETIRGLENKLEDFKFFNQPRTPSCAGSCQVF